MPVTGHRRRILLPVLALGCVAVLGACSVVSPSTAANAPSGTTAPATRTSTTSSPTTTTPSAPVVLTPSVAAGAADVPVDTLVKVGAQRGTVADVKMTYRDRKTGSTVPVQGVLDPAGASWTASSLLEPGSTYDLSMTGKNVDGLTATTATSFTTQDLSLKQQIFPTIVGGGVVGVAMPVIVRFDVPVTDRASIERHLRVTSTPSQPGTWSWLSNNEVHYRPASYWKPGTTVKVDVDINSVPAGRGTYGQKSVTGGFTVARSLVMKADLATDQLSVTIGGQLARTIPVTGGKTGFLSRSGTKVIMEKFSTLRMDANTVGIEPGDPNYYNIPDVRYAMRETNSGEFLHAAPWSVASQGKANVSHGCVGMSTDNAAWLFAQVKVGDPVVVTGTTRTLEQGNGWTDWNVSYAQYQKGSAL